MRVTRRPLLLALGSSACWLVVSCGSDRDSDGPTAGTAGTGGARSEDSKGGRSSAGERAEGGAQTFGGSAGDSGSGRGGTTSAGGSRPAESRGGRSSGGERAEGGSEPLGGTAGSSGEAAAAGSAGAAGADTAAGGAGGADGRCDNASCAPPSCEGLAVSQCAGSDCCATSLVPGWTFQQGEPDAFASTVGDFLLDEFEVTVGRFRNFVSAYDDWRAAGHPRAGAGEHTHVAGSGWNAAWTASLSADAVALKAALNCGSGEHATWAESGGDTLPITCVDWYTAFAFCIWDGGRLPTDAEAEYAAAGGSRDYLYPWGNTPVLTDKQDASTDYAVYLCLADGSGPTDACSPADLPTVGSRTAGRGFFGQVDLVGSVWEWSLDWWQQTYPSVAQVNYAKLDAGTFRTTRGGSWDNTAKLVNAASRTGMNPISSLDTVGLRCARNARP